MLFLAFASVLLCTVASMAQNAAPSVRITGRVDDNDLVTLAGNTHPAARAQYDRGAVNPSLRMESLVLVLKRGPEQQAAFDEFTAGLSDPASPNYHQWLEPEEVGERFGPAQSDIDVIENWLRSHGLAIKDVGKDHMTIHFSGTAAQVEDAFHVEIHNLDVRGEAHFANMSDPRIPAALAPVVAGPKALHNFRPLPLHRVGGRVKFNQEKGGWERLPASDSPRSNDRVAGARPQFTINVPASGGNSAYVVEDVAPYDFATIYNVAPLWSKGIDGTGQTIAIAGTSEIDTNDLTTFRKAFGLPPVPSFNQVVADGLNPGQCGVNPSEPAYCTGSDQIENSLDTEWSGAVAKGANLLLVVSGEDPSGSIDTVYESSYYVIQNKSAAILNVSYGLCELAEGTGGNTTYNELWHTAYAEGIAVFVATGDSGSPSCDQGGEDGGNDFPNLNVAEFGLQVSGIASTPWNTAIGGTDFNWGSTPSPYWSSGDNATTKASALGYVPEVVWNDSCLNPLVLPDLQSDAHQVGLSTPSDAEQGCNFIVEYYEDSGDDSLNFLVDTVGGSGGRSACTTNNTTSSSTTLDPQSCGGGYPKPAWQAGVTGIPSDGHRDIPDVSFFASDGFLGSAYLICVSSYGPCTYSDTSENVYTEVGGTSGASPAMAGVMALIDQKAGAPWGSPNAELYTLAGKQSYGSCSAESVRTSSSCYFNDIDTGNNSGPCDWGLIEQDSPNCQVIHSGDEVGTLEGYKTATGFDLATGLGSLNVANVVNAWPPAPDPAVTLSTTTLTFAATAKGTSSAAQTITLKNTGLKTLSLSGSGAGFKISGTGASSFSETNTCGTAVDAGSSCAIHVVFKPAAAGKLTASLTIGDNAFGSPQTISLSGLGAVASIRLSKSGLIFPATAVGKNSAAIDVTLENSGTVALSISLIEVAGTNPLSFHEENNCGKSVAAGKSCTIAVVFEPKKSGPLSAEVTIADAASGSPQKVTLSGSGAGPAATLSTSSLTFPSTAVGDVAATQSFTLTNKGTAKLGKPGGGQMIAITGTNVQSFTETNNCDNGLAAGAHCTVTVKFTPRKTGALSAAVTFTDNAEPSTQEVKLSGTGH
jgi:hypothetical protein